MSCCQTPHSAGSGSFSILVLEEIEAHETQLVVFNLVLSICFCKPLRANGSPFRKEWIRPGDGGKANRFTHS